MDIYHHFNDVFRQGPWTSMNSAQTASLRGVLADHITLLGPIFPEATVGKDAVVEVLSCFCKR